MSATKFDKFLVFYFTLLLVIFICYDISLLFYNKTSHSLFPSHISEFISPVFICLDSILVDENLMVKHEDKI